MSEYLSWAKYVALVLFIVALLIVIDFEGPGDILEFGLILFFGDYSLLIFGGVCRYLRRVLILLKSSRVAT